MKYEEARLQLKKALTTQKTISIPKLRAILESMNVSTKGQGEDKPLEVKYQDKLLEVRRLKRSLHKAHRKLQREGQRKR